MNLKRSRDNLFLYNSYTKKKEKFKPLNGNTIKWYNCGPTVYDVSHMGHARCYISFDIIRRVLSKYFKYQIEFVQNITDIDDKIIKKARQIYLWNEFIQNFDNQNFEDFTSNFKDSLTYYSNKIEMETDFDKKKLLKDQLNAALSIKDLKNKDIFIEKGQPVFIDYLDYKLGFNVKDNSIFNELPRKFEHDFNLDMESLNILKPTYSPRVMEYIEQIIDFIVRLIKNGFAYESNNSVYFNTFAFNEKHKYGKLASEAIGNINALNQGEGDLFCFKEKFNEKKNTNDFALWKSSKPGEPFWLSPWGNGRPGWHIECSAMACSLLGDYVDIHSGGIDLKFPHHENEIAQTEGYLNTGKNWVQFFLHTGHLHVEGCKMSKSLKNFVSIKEALINNTSRQIRLAFLLHAWEDSLNYSKETLHEAISYEKSFKEFFFLLENYFSNHNTVYLDKNEWTSSEKKLNNHYLETLQLVDDCLCDNINTKETLLALKNLISNVNVYITEKLKQKVDINLLKEIAKFITEILKIFGVVNEIDIGFGLSNDSKFGNISKKEIIMPYVKVLCDFREQVRKHAKNLKSNDLLAVCDKLRDYVLPILGVRLDDKEIDGIISTVIKIDEEQLAKDEETLRKEEEEKENLKKQKLIENNLKKLEFAKAQTTKKDLKKIPPSELFLLEKHKYSKFNEFGIPTHDFEGKELSKSHSKKLFKLYQIQEKNYKEFLATKI